MVDMEIRSAEGRGGDANNGIGIIQDTRNGNVLHSHLEGDAFVDDCAHTRGIQD